MKKNEVSSQLKTYCELKGVGFGPISETISFMLLAGLYNTKNEDKSKKMTRAACLVDYLFNAGMTCMFSLLNTSPFEGLIQSDVDFDMHEKLRMAEKEYRALCRKLMLAILGFTPWPKNIRKPSMKKYKGFLDMIAETIRRAHNRAIFQFTGHGDWDKFMNETWAVDKK